MSAIDEKSFIPAPEVNPRPTTPVRSNEQILADIHEIYGNDPGIDVSKIFVSVDNHVVLLRGSVADLPSKEKAQFLIASVAGIEAIRNELSINGSNTVH